MKNLKKIVVIFILLIGSPKVNSQENTLTEIAIINQNIDYKLTATISQNQTNNAIITQIGNQNHNQNTIIANQSIIQVYQNGHFNLTDIYRVENEVNEYIIQNGNGNSINEMSIGNYNTIDNQYIQKKKKYFSKPIHFIIFHFLFIFFFNNKLTEHTFAKLFIK